MGEERKREGEGGGGCYVCIYYVELAHVTTHSVELTQAHKTL